MSDTFKAGPQPLGTLAGHAPYCDTCYASLEIRDGVAQPHDLRDCLLHDMDLLVSLERRVLAMVRAVGRESVNAFREMLRGEHAERAKASASPSPSPP
jgi:hypothetical protein